MGTADTELPMLPIRIFPARASPGAVPTGTRTREMNTMHDTPDALGARLAEARYVADETLVTAISLALDLERPLLIEGEAGVGKTEVAKALAVVLDTRLIRLQCYEGLDVTTAIYEWNYQRQLLAIKASERESMSAVEAEAHVFSERYLLRRPLLEAISEPRSCVLLIDEIDRADEEFEAYLLEILSDFQITVPEIGTLTATSVPHVILTSNGTTRAFRRPAPSLPVLLRRVSIARARARDPAKTPARDRAGPRLADRALRARSARGGSGETPRRGRDPRLGRRAHGPRHRGALAGFEAPAHDPHLSAQDRGGSQVRDSRGAQPLGRPCGVNAEGALEAALKSVTREDLGRPTGRAA